jgi:hypothetical protein
MTRCASVELLGSSASTFRPSDSSRCTPRDEVAMSTTSGLSATMVSMLGSMPPPACGRLRTDAGWFE